MKYYKVNCMIIKKDVGHVHTYPIVVCQSIFGLHEEQSKQEVFTTDGRPISELSNINWKKFECTGYLLLVKEEDLNSKNRVAWDDVLLSPLEQLQLEVITYQMDRNTIKHYEESIKKLIKKK